MANPLRFLVLAKRATAAKNGASDTLPDRRKELLAIAAVGAKVRHDSGGRLLVIEIPESAEQRLLKLLPGAALVLLEPEQLKRIDDLTPGESLFLEALRIRSSTAYRDAKARRKYGESPEEKLLSTGSCVKGY